MPPFFQFFFHFNTLIWTKKLVILNELKKKSYFKRERKKSFQPSFTRTVIFARTSGKKTRKRYGICKKGRKKALL